MALTLREAEGLERLIMGPRRVLPLAVLMALGLYASFRRFRCVHGTVIMLGVSAMAPFYVSQLVRVLDAGVETITSRFFSSRVMRKLGKYGHGLYVVHWPLV